MINIVKRHYSKPFRQEVRSPLEIILYRLLNIIIWPIYYIKHRNTLRKTKSFIKEKSHNIRSNNKSVFVFANGPSISDIDLKKIKRKCEVENFDLIAINSFLSKSSHIVKPTCAAFADNVHFSKIKNQYTNDIDACENQSIPYFIPAKYVDKENPLQIGFCGLVNIDGNNTSDITRPLGYYGVTAFFALSIAKMLGYSNIYICGFDNSYFRDFGVDADGGMNIHHKHYYDAQDKDTRIPHLYKDTSDFFFDTYRHFQFIEKITSNNTSIENIARSTFISSVRRSTSLDVYFD